VGFDGTILFHPPHELLFANGFESGDPGGWSVAEP
jgi:hypothetical protein